VSVPSHFMPRENITYLCWDRIARDEKMNEKIPRPGDFK